ncbi:MAG: hypothetical protein M3457_08130 [Chloroflexota bacterium]|nr:hypothetical protein [Chloroflexota bacterium]
MNALTDFSRNVDQRRAGFRSIDATDDYTPGAQFPIDFRLAGWAGMIDG